MEAINLTTTIKLWGNSAAVRIPRTTLNQAGFDVNSDVEVDATKKGEIIIKAVRKRKSIQDLFAEYNEGYSQTGEVDWGKTQGDEVW